MSGCADLVATVFVRFGHRPGSLQPGVWTSFGLRKKEGAIKDAVAGEDFSVSRGLYLFDVIPSPNIGSKSLLSAAP